MSAPDWKIALPAPPPGARLHEAWLTSFEQPDASLLVEHFLPSLLGASHEPAQDPQERNLFFGELATALEALHGRLTVISSPPRAARQDPAYPWLWRYVSPFIVGAERRAVQHAKLWALHWRVGDEDYLELHISSTNLTSSAFKGQVQAGWQASLPVSQRARQSDLRSWGALIPFLEALGVAAGDVATTRLQRLVALLSRAACPEDVTFVASIAGDTGPARQLKQFDVSEIHMLAPTIGEWNERTLSDWSRDVGVTPDKLHLKWISQQHPWATTKSGWALSTAARETLDALGAQLECLPNDARFTDQHRDGDTRWSHAKLYLLRSGRKRRLLVTSANWSVSAWGAGRTAPSNFELGVVFDSDWTELEAMRDPFSPPETVPFCLSGVEEDARGSVLEWAEGSWDGTRIQLRARSSDLSIPITAGISFSGGEERPSLVLVDGSATLPWRDPEHPPLSALLTQGAEMLEVDIVDLRLPGEFAKTPLPEVDRDIAAAVREAFLLQRYGGPAVEAESIPGLTTRRPPGIAAPVAGYSVQAWLDARAAFDVIDTWRAALADAKSDPALFEQVRLDGDDLRALYERRTGVAAALVAEELRWRLDEEG